MLYQREEKFWKWTSWGLERLFLPLKKSRGGGLDGEKSQKRRRRGFEPD